MRFFEILVLAIMASWFLCSERLDTAKETSDDAVANVKGNAADEAQGDVKEPEAAGPDATSETKAAWGAIAALVIVAVSFL
jgi:hypothetical protein